MTKAEARFWYIMGRGPTTNQETSWEHSVEFSQIWRLYQASLPDRDKIAHQERVLSRVDSLSLRVAALGDKLVGGVEARAKEMSDSLGEPLPCSSETMPVKLRTMKDQESLCSGGYISWSGVRRCSGCAIVGPGAMVSHEVVSSSEPSPEKEDLGSLEEEKSAPEEAVKVCGGYMKKNPRGYIYTCTDCSWQTWISVAASNGYLCTRPV